MLLQQAVDSTIDLCEAPHQSQLLQSCSDTAQLTCANSYINLTHWLLYNNAGTCIGNWSHTVVACLQGIPNSMQSSPSLSQQQMSQIISAGGASYKQAQLQPNTIPLSHGKVRRAHQSVLYWEHPVMHMRIH